MNKHEFYTMANAQGQHRFPRETFKEFERRVFDLKKKQDKRTLPWRRDNTK